MSWTSVGQVVTSAFLNTVFPLGDPAAQAWTDFIPTLSAGWLLGNSTYTARYTRIGRTVHFYADITVGSTATKGTYITAALPVTAANAATVNMGLNCTFLRGTDIPGFIFDATTSTVNLYYYAENGTYITVGVPQATTPSTWATGDRIFYGGTYEAAS